MDGEKKPSFLVVIVLHSWPLTESLLNVIRLNNPVFSIQKDRNQKTRREAPSSTRQQHRNSLAKFAVSYPERGRTRETINFLVWRHWWTQSCQTCPLGGAPRPHRLNLTTAGNYTWRVTVQDVTSLSKQPPDYRCFVNTAECRLNKITSADT